MNYYHLKSILGSDKKSLPLRSPSLSFRVVMDRNAPYIEPTFEKVLYEEESPTIVLVSAVGATGKSALASVLSYDCQLPVFDLAKHKPVGDNTLTGLLTSVYDLKDISSLLVGLSNGSYGLIIDGIDEGRSKTTEKGFEAFLDDIANLCGQSQKTTIIMLGRSQIVDECWAYLSDKGLRIGLVTISPFTVDGAKKYIDEFTRAKSSRFLPQYEAARDHLINKLGSAFSSKSKEKASEFVSFIGYPPVLDAIVTLLREENNYHKLLNDLIISNGNDLEITLLYRIATYIAERERSLKVLPNIIQPLLEEAPDAIRQPAMTEAFSLKEQSIRLIAYCLGDTVTLTSISEPKLNDKYEEQLSSWLPEHPFLSGRAFRNAVFEALALSTLMASGDALSERLVSRYAASHKHSYHLIYMASVACNDYRIASSHLNILVTAAMEFRSVHSTVEVQINEESSDNTEDIAQAIKKLRIEIEVLVGSTGESAKSFLFESSAQQDTKIVLGPRLAGVYAELPCDVELIGPLELELGAPIQISGRSVILNASFLVGRTAPQKDGDHFILLNASTLESHVETIRANGTTVEISLDDMTGLSYPAVQYTKQKTVLPADPQLVQKYIRLKRILLEFRSHSKGSLAKIRHKIEHERVLRNDTGRAILDRLLHDRILYLEGKFYHVNQERLSKHLGTTWQDFRRGNAPDLLLTYLRSIS